MWAIGFFFQAEDGIRDIGVTGVQTCALPIWPRSTADVSVDGAAVATHHDPSASGTSGGGGDGAGGGGLETTLDRKSVVEGKSVDLGGRRIIKKNVDMID